MMPTRVKSWCRLCLLGFLAGAGLFACAGKVDKPAADSQFKGDPREAKRRLAFELMSRREWDGALAYIDDLRRELPDDAELLTWRGIVLREKGLLSEAEADLRLALETQAKRPDTHAALGILYDMQRLGDKAELHHRKAVEARPEDPALLNNLGFSLFLHGKERDAVPVLQRAARVSPTNRRIRTNLGFALAGAGDWSAAAREFSHGGSLAEAKNNLGYAYERRGHLAQAFDLYAEAARLDPGARRPRLNLANVARALDREVPPELVVPAQDAADEPAPPQPLTPSSGFAPENPVDEEKRP